MCHFDTTYDHNSHVAYKLTLLADASKQIQEEEQ